MSKTHGKRQPGQRAAKAEDTPPQGDAAHTARPGGPPPSSSEWARAMARESTLAPGAIPIPAVVAAVPGSVIAPSGRPFDLRSVDPDGDGGLDKEESKTALSAEHERIKAAQEKLYAERRQSLLVVFQAIDTGGKDGTIRSVFEGVNPQGCRVWSFKVPSSEERDHDFLWRYHAKAPGRGMIGVFNRSHYEDVLVVRVKDIETEAVWRPRYGLINAFEQMLTLSGTTVLKFFLHISKEEQKERLEARIADPEKHWKFDPADLVERRSWDAYQSAFGDAIGLCSTPYAPWRVVPANRKWFRNLVVARTIADTLEAMDPRYPEAQPGIAKLKVED
ncbi:MAG: polyphosphate kinase 2 family protein [Methylobacterium sp.]|uniref:polyphosphate kinase 2 family protein n=1 Tax=Methylobacterium sp. TaxID=409 RepID=UPI0025F7350C|nr:polyphosphate kinase 2 family protein [Methylobacterium sp.]MBX9931193.1 polyphosphate kinase 2 family protein [Methylobacterium sp.]